MRIFSSFFSLFFFSLELELSFCYSACLRTPRPVSFPSRGTLTCIQHGTSWLRFSMFIVADLRLGEITTLY